jgi:acetyl esterase/lipase
VLSDIQTPYTRDDIPRLRKQYAIQVSPVLEGVVEEGRNIPVRDGSTIPIRVHSPSKRPAGGSPLVVNYHGGGFILGDPDPSTDFCRSLVTAFRVVVVNVDYRLAPEHPFPTPINDAWDALQWVSRFQK